MLTSFPLSGADRNHWNYFLALENDLIKCTRYIEFNLQNKSVFSIELAQILMTAASEVDVLAKLIVAHVDPSSPRKNIDDYRATITKYLPDFSSYKVSIARYGLKVEPWADWNTGVNPKWWRSYNDVKHERDKHFSDATIENAISAVAGLLVSVIQYYRLKLAKEGVLENEMHETTSYLQPSSSLMLLDGNYYAGVLSFWSKG